LAKLDLKLNMGSGVPFYRQIVDQTARLIRGGALEEGARLPSVRELAKEMLVSLITVRRSYSDLEAAGLIVRKQGQGTFVAPTDNNTSRSAAISEAKLLIEEAVEQARRLGLDGLELNEYLGRVSGKF
jgi:DNA-binding transcriptional regulator YhcF (GntR family)